MLYSEFVENTGCKQTDHNYQVYKRLEILYMNDNTITKEEIYEYGRKLVDNSLTDEQVAWNNHINRLIDDLKERIATGKEDIVRYEDNLNWAKQYYRNKEEVKFWQRALKDEKVTLRGLRNEVRALKECLYTE